MVSFTDKPPVLHPASTEVCERWLEEGGWTRKVAGELDFLNASRALQIISNRPWLGLLVSGKVGSGKTSLIEAVTRKRNVFRVNLGIDSDIEKLSPAYLANFAINIYTCDVFLDDLGAEKPTWKDVVGDFLYKWHFYRTDRTRFWGTTNLDDEGFFGYMTERVLDRGKEMFYPLMLTGQSKREIVTEVKFPNLETGDWEPQ